MFQLSVQNLLLSFAQSEESEKSMSPTNCRMLHGYCVASEMKRFQIQIYLLSSRVSLTRNAAAKSILNCLENPARREPTIQPRWKGQALKINHNIVITLLLHVCLITHLD